MSAKSVVIGDIGREHSLEMPLVEHDDMIEHIAPNAADDPLAVGILPGTSRGNLDMFDAHILDALRESHTVNRVPIPQQVTRHGVPRKSLDNLLGGPLRRWMFGDVEMHDAPTLMSQQDEHKQHVEGGGGHSEKIARDDIRDMVVQKGLPRGRWRLADARAVLFHRGFGHVNAQLTQFPHNARRPPLWVRTPHILDEVYDIFGGGGTARLAAPAKLPPVIPGAFFL